jgi:hypothetical protein
MNTFNKNILIAGIISISCALSSCNSTLDTDPPTDEISAEQVFTSANGIRIARTGLYVYNFLSNSVYYQYLPRYYSMFSDDMIHRQTSWEEEYANAYTESSSFVGTVWNNLYKSIRQSNIFIENVAQTNIISKETCDQYLADALFFRALGYFYLTNSFGDVPLILSTNAEETGSLPRVSQSLIYAQIESDLLEAAEKLNDTDNSVVYISSDACYALLARVYTYTEQWDKAIEYANKLIPTADGGSGTKYQLEEIAKVYKSSSKEAIFSANIEGYSGSGTYVGYTTEGANFVPSANTVNYQLTSNLVNLLKANPDDQRNSWIDNRKGVYFPYKYKNRETPAMATDYEYQNWFRLTEDYLIRAEALAHQGNLEKAVEDINKIRNRAGLSDLDATVMSQEDVLNAVLEERQKEFFCEMGHRFFDLRRTGKIDEVLGACDWKSWKSYLQWLPIPLAQTQYNSNLTQNDGYSK